MLLSFNDWVLVNTNYRCIVNHNELSDSVVIDVDTDKYIARFTVWDDKSCMSEIIKVDTGDYLINKRNEFNDLKELLYLFHTFNDLLN
ncbi:immunity protein TriTu family protein [Scandinavium hiltneri]|uniref:immunity protein TriTu family protein n=1 Tax=Scandinavium hiltneri TaxID=2926519 RepID=UPI004040AB4C